jgi:hypothetical protein
MTFSVKQLQASITINPSSTTPTFNGSSANTITFGGPGDNAVRMSVKIHNAEGVDGSADISVYGLPLSVMQQLSTYGTQINLLPKNQITVFAGDDSAPLVQAFSGSIIGSVIDFNQPDVAMRMTANSAAAFSAVVAQPQSYNGATNVATAMQQIAGQMGLQFENNGVNSNISNVYLYGSPRDQYNALVRAADIGATIDRGTLAIWPKFQNRNGSPTTISPQDGSMIGYPVYTATGVQLRALYNTNFGIGRQVTVQGSQIDNCNATWNIFSVDHDLESQAPGGKWESLLQTSSPKFPTPIA